MDRKRLLFKGKRGKYELMEKVIIIIKDIEKLESEIKG